MAATALTGRAQAAGIEAIALSPRLGDFNEDLRMLGIEALRAAEADLGGRYRLPIALPRCRI
jgi:hypothetical protein